MSFLRSIQRFNLKTFLSIFKHNYTTQSISRIPNTDFAPILSSTLVQNHWIWQQPTRIEAPISKITSIDVPKSIFWIPTKSDPEVANLEIQDPELEINKYEKKAVKLIVIRRHKMRKHKLRKLRKRMKFEWAKKRQRREMKKEKEFQGGLIAQIKQTEVFSAQEYVADKIRQATEEPIPRFFKGKRLPEFIIREKLGFPPK